MEKKILVCDKCDKNISNEDFYICEIDLKPKGTKMVALQSITQGDFCKDCFKKILKDELNSI